MFNLQFNLVFIVLLLVSIDESNALRGALFRSGRSIPFDRLPGTQQFRTPKTRERRQACQEFEIFAPCVLVQHKTCLIDRICLNPDLMPRRAGQSVVRIENSRRNDFLRFGRSITVDDSSKEENGYKIMRIPILE